MVAASSSAHMRRSASNQSRGPPQIPADASSLLPGRSDGMMGYDIDSANPSAADFVYRMDDQEQREEQGTDGFSLGGSGGDTAEPTSAKDDVEDHLDNLAWARNRPWWKRPSNTWLRPFAFLLAFTAGLTMSPKQTLYLVLVCDEIRPQTSGQSGMVSINPPEWRLNECRSDGPVVAAWADLQLKLTLVMGILSVVTTGWWTGLSDRRGRVFVLSIVVTGLIAADVVTIVVALGHSVRSDYLLIGSLIEGFLGGFATLMAGHQAYIADTTPDGTRARVFSLFTGIFYGGFAFGPAIGGMISHRAGNIMITFYAALTSHVIYFIFVALVLPESSSPKRRAEAIRDFDSRGMTKSPTSSNNRERRMTLQRRLRTIIRQIASSRLLAPLHPIAMVLPSRVAAHEVTPTVHHAAVTPQIVNETTPLLDPHNGDAEGEAEQRTTASANQSHISVSYVPARSSKSRKPPRDWNLFILSCTYFLDSATMGVLTAKGLYAQYEFQWNTETLGVYLSYSAICRVLAMTIILPFIIKLAHKPVKRIALPQDEALYARSAENVDVPPSATFLDAEGRRVSFVDGADDDISSPSTPMPDVGDLIPTIAGDVAYKARLESQWTARASYLRRLHDSAFDLRLAKGSFLAAATAYLCLAATSSPAGFVFGSGFAALGGSTGAAMSSLALALLRSPAHAGKLFGAWSILGAIAGTVIGPSLFVLVFEKTAQTMPHAIFFLCASMYITCVIMLMFVRVRPSQTLPALPARPHTPASTMGRSNRRGSELPTTPTRSPEAGDDDDVGQSTRSQIRLKRPAASDVFKTQAPSK